MTKVQEYKGFEIHYNLTHDWFEAKIRKQHDDPRFPDILEATGLHATKRQDVVEKIDKHLKRKKKFPIAALRLRGQRTPEVGRITSWMPDRRGQGDIWFVYDKEQLDGKSPGFSREKIALGWSKFVKPTEGNIQRAKVIIASLTKIDEIKHQITEIENTMTDIITEKDFE